MVSADVLNRKVHPKLSIAIEYILSVEMLTEDEKKKYKKKFADGMATFKIEFDTAGIVNGMLVRTEENSQPGTLASIDLNENKSNSTVEQPDKKSIKTWYISLGEPENSTK